MYIIYTKHLLFWKKSCINSIIVVSNIGFEMLIETLKKRFFLLFYTQLVTKSTQKIDASHSKLQT